MRVSWGSFRVHVGGWLSLALCASIGLAGVVQENNLLLALFSVLAGVLAVSALLTVLVALRVEVSRVAPEAVVAGERFSVGVRVRNAKRLWPAFALKIEDRLTCGGRLAAVQPDGTWLPLARPGALWNGAYGATAPARGWASLGPLTITSEFTPGLFRYRRAIPGEEPLLVFPRRGVLHRRLLEPLLSLGSQEEAGPMRGLSSHEEFAGLRPYRPGDPPRHIHWKMSARLQRGILVREFSTPQVRTATVLLETWIPDPHDSRRRRRLELAVSFAATLAETLLGENYRVRFKAFGPEPVVIALEPQRGALDDLLYALAILQPTRVHEMGDLGAQEGAAEGEVTFLLRIGEKPLPDTEALRRAVVIDVAAMRDLMQPGA